MQRHRSTRYWIALAALALPAAAGAQGFGLNEISTCGIGRAFAATATGCHDASTLYWNPAAATTLSGWSILAGAASIAIDGKFVRDTTFATYKGDVPTAYVPHFFLSHHAAGSQYALGIGMYVPYGLTSQWGDDFPGRFAAKKASLQTIYVQPNIAWQLNDRVSIGGGPVIGHSSVELVQGVDLSTTPVTGQTFTFAALGIPRYTEFARAKLKGDAWGFGAHLGAQFKLTPTWTAGLRFLTPVKFSYDDADATFTPVTTGLVFGGAVPPSIPAGTSVDALVAPAFQSGGPLVSQKVKTSITHPAQVQLGFAYTGFANWELEGDYAWIGYKSFKELKVDFANSTTPDRVLIEDYNNSSGIRLTAERRFSNNIRLRAGFAGVAAAAPDVTVSPLLPEQDRTNYGVGATLPFGAFALDVAYLRVQAAGRRGRIDERSSRNITADQINSGVYSLNANILALSLKANF